MKDHASQKFSLGTTQITVISPWVLPKWRIFPWKSSINRSEIRIEETTVKDHASQKFSLSATQITVISAWVLPKWRIFPCESLITRSEICQVKQLEWKQGWKVIRRSYACIGKNKREALGRNAHADKHGKQSTLQQTFCFVINRFVTVQIFLITKTSLS